MYLIHRTNGFPTRPQSQYPIRQRGPFLPLSSDNRCSVNTLGTCAEPLQTDLSSVTGRQLKPPPHSPPPPPPSSNRRSAYPCWAHTGTLSNLTQVHLLEPRLFKDISGILTRSHDSEGNGSVRLSLQSTTEAGAGDHTGSCRTNTVCARISPAGVPWCPLPKTHLGSC